MSIGDTFMNPVEALLNNDPAEFRDGIQDMLMQKLSDRLDLERVNVAASMFGDPDLQVSDEGDDEDFEDDEYDVSDEDEEEDFYTDDDDDDEDDEDE